MSTAMSSAVVDSPRELVAVPIVGLIGDDPLVFPLYIDTGKGRHVLYKDARSDFDESTCRRLQSEGVERVFILSTDRRSYHQRAEERLDALLKDRSLGVEARGEVLYGVAGEMAADLLATPPDAPRIERASRVMSATASLLLREPKAMSVLRRVMQAGADLRRHSLTVGFLSMGLARHVLGADPTTLVQAGLAGMLHDVGKVGFEDDGDDPDHTTRGAKLLHGLGMPQDICDAAMYHHERTDGSGFPRGLRGTQIPELARVVGLVNTFDKVYASQQPRVGVFDALRIVAQVYRGCFDERLAVGLVTMFKS
jgi:putative nucleotidyltransferase with HDIG domain